MFQDKIGTGDSPLEAEPRMLRGEMTCAKLIEWVKLAQPNARLTYGEGSILAYACTPMVADKVMELSTAQGGKGMLTPHFVRGRNGEPSRYIVQRTQRPYLKGMEL